MNNRDRFQNELDVLTHNQSELESLKNQSNKLSERITKSHAELQAFNEQRNIKWDPVKDMKPLILTSNGEVSWDQLVNVARANQAKQAQYSDFLTDKEIFDCVTAVQDLRKELKDDYSTKMIDELKDSFLSTLIGPFGLSLDMLRAFDGGVIPTVHNANREEPIIPNDPTGERSKDYQSKYNRDNYAPKYEMNKNRKERFQDQEPLIDGYTDKPLERDGRSHIEHVISASELHNDDWARLFVSTEKRKEFVNSEANITWTNSGLNQSKSDKDLLEWMNIPSKKDPTKTNAEYFEIDQEKAKELYNKARSKRNQVVYQSVAKEVLIQCGKTSIVMGFRKALGYILYEFAKEVFNETRDVLQKRKQQSINVKHEFTQRLNRITQSLLSKWKEVLKQFADGAIAGFFSELIVFIINNFITTMKRLVRIIKEGIMSLIEMIRFVLNPPKDLMREEIYQQCLKMVTTILITSGGILLEEAIEKFLMANVWAAPFAGFLSPIITGLLTGLTLSVVIYEIDKIDLFGSREKKIDQQISQRIMDDLWSIEAEFDSMIVG